MTSRLFARAGLLLVFVGLGLVPPTVGYGTWCGKYYEVGAPRTPPPPESKFAHPPQGDVQLLDFRCIPASSIYLEGDITEDPPRLVVDANLTFDLGEPCSAAAGAQVLVTVELDGQYLTSSSVILGATATVLPLPLTHLPPSLDAHAIKCKAEVGGTTYVATSELFYLPPNPWGGSAVKLDRLTGGMRVKRRPSESGWEEILPFGWYDSIDVNERTQQSPSHPAPVVPPGDLQHWFTSSGRAESGVNVMTNMQRLDMAAELGFNLIHPVPPSTSYAPDGDDSAISAYFAHAEKRGVGVMYDMRHSFTDMELVRQQVAEHRHHPSLLVWYTSDEPDGPALPLSSAADARALIRQLDPYHPVSLVLNCADYHFAAYAAGADILLADPYPVALNPLWSKKWGTPVTRDFGCSGCDGCRGNLYDVAGRLDEWRARLRAVRRDREVQMWIVPQAFDDAMDEFWWRVPSGDEGAAQIVMAFNHGAVGHCAWLASSSTPELLGNASFIFHHLSRHLPFLIANSHTRHPLSTSVPHDGQNGLDVACWTRVVADEEDVDYVDYDHYENDHGDDDDDAGFDHSHSQTNDYDRDHHRDHDNPLMAHTDDDVLMHPRHHAGIGIGIVNPAADSGGTTEQALVLAVNGFYGPHTVTFTLPSMSGWTVRRVLFGQVTGGHGGEVGFVLGRMGVGGVVLERRRRRRREAARRERVGLVLPVRSSEL